jgi:hypothetical protein
MVDAEAQLEYPIDTWLGGVMLLGILVSGAAAIGLLFQEGSRRSRSSRSWQPVWRSRC